MTVKIRVVSCRVVAWLGADEIVCSVLFHLEVSGGWSDARVRKSLPKWIDAA